MVVVCCAPVVVVDRFVEGDRSTRAVLKDDPSLTVLGEGCLAPVYGRHGSFLAAINHDVLGVHERCCGVETYFDSIQVEPVKRGDLAHACRLGVVVCDDSDGDAFLVNSIQQGGEYREGLISLVLQGTPNADSVAFRLVVGALAPTIKPWGRGGRRSLMLLFVVSFFFFFCVWHLYYSLGNPIVHNEKWVMLMYIYTGGRIICC